MITGGAGNDVFQFATTIVGVGASGTVAAVTASVGTDTITEFVVANDQFQLDQTVFNASIGTDGGTLGASQFVSQAGTGAVTEATGDLATDGGIIFDTTARNVYYVERGATLVSGTTTLAQLVTASEATIIANITTLTGTLAATDFNIVA